MRGRKCLEVMKLHRGGELYDSDNKYQELRKATLALIQNTHRGFAIGYAHMILRNKFHKME